MTGTGTVAAAKARRNRQRPTPTSPSLPAASVTFASSTSSAAMPAASPQVEPDSGADASDSDDATNTDIHTAASTPSAAFAASSASAADAGKASKRKPAAAEGSLASRELQAMPDLRENETASAASPTSRAEFTTVYDIIDKMENLLEEAKSSVFTPSVAKVDREEFLGALADLKKMLPVQLERASALMRESERRLDGAQTQANAIISEAQSRAADVVKEAGKQAEFLAGQENVVAIAQRKAQVILDKAQAQSDKLVQGANQYSSKVMEALASQLERYQQDVQAGVEVLREREREAASKLEGSYSDQNPDQHSDQ
ncbi:hypothetical protein AB656_07370 [Bifidobacterium actinocoloniiforme DSM 22766]|nr:cell division protein [Bifidobacterium actinocoloniiforme]AKV56223.1 hypothetical protein AB656_07370 [Bifidobacterium actinocoloniiforme DSM 22766]